MWKYEHNFFRDLQLSVKAVWEANRWRNLWGIDRWQVEWPHKYHFQGEKRLYDKMLKWTHKWFPHCISCTEWKKRELWKTLKQSWCGDWGYLYNKLNSFSNKAWLGKHFIDWEALPSVPSMSNLTIMCSSLEGIWKSCPSGEGKEDITKS